MFNGNQMRQQQKFTAAEQQIISLGRVLQSLREEDNIDGLIATTISYLQDQFAYSLIKHLQNSIFCGKRTSIEVF
ncbi:MAG: hypothetical protein KME28_00210 [Pelatocladus maniniholoensis HA4357-MV3]|jgi:hypothetical protein|uniref:Uncharacterized protein n=1 Tax=Pelatocladus maniniholoensis HA4357-MV3 TaxID=1117104 RepID=A0A9E3H4W1_9NOST|nr:hypothetical protein [Pelatocladus maniniholoensis HA4357-MV3]